LELSLEQLLLGNEQGAFSIIDKLTTAEQILPVELQRVIIHYLLRLGAQLKLMDLDIYEISGKSLEDWLIELEATVTRSSLMSKIKSLIHELSHVVEQERSAPDTPLSEKVKQYVMQYLADGVSLQSVADRFGMNASYFSRWFKFETGQNFVVFLKDTRIARAKSLIEQGRNSMQEISQLIGYADIKHFYRVFKEYTGYSPSEYKKNHSR